MVLYRTLVETAWRRIKLNKNFIITIVGSTGSGKSYGALWLAERIDPHFSIENICFSPYDFMKLINDHMTGKKILPKGSVIIIEEAGIQYSARAWSSFNNKMLGMISQSFRSMNWVFIFTLPTFAWFEKQARELTHLILDAMDRIDYRQGKAYFRINELRSDHFTGDLRLSYPWIIKKDGERARIKVIALGKPSKRLRDAYEKLKVGFQVHVSGDLFQRATEYEFKMLKRKPTSNI